MHTVEHFSIQLQSIREMANRSHWSDMRLRCEDLSSQASPTQQLQNIRGQTTVFQSTP